MSQPVASAQPQPGQQQIKTSSQRSPVAINIANYLRDNKILKQRTGLLNNKDDIDIFRFKRLSRALLSEDYKAKQKNPKNGLVPIPNEQEVAKVFILLIQNQLIIPLEKLHYDEIKKVKGWKPNKSKPTLRPSQKASLEPDSYFGWTYTKPNPYILLYSILTIIGIFAIILFPLWPAFMKIGVWYLSMAALGLIGLFFLVAIIRLIIYLISLVVMPKAFWLYPNLFEDCGVIESFQPLYAWEEPKQAKKSKKAKKGSKSNTQNTDATKSSSTGASTSSSAPVKRKVILEEVDE